ncbi:hypothetical protein EV359DRAFT_86471 [Lentinula novae-zelandiae]|nr:hypothetical protein EV359DRAFT_86471 [Lentinula novae-zelandiae]
MYETCYTESLYTISTPDTLTGRLSGISPSSCIRTIDIVVEDTLEVEVVRHLFKTAMLAIDAGVSNKALLLFRFRTSSMGIRHAMDGYTFRSLKYEELYFKGCIGTSDDISMAVQFFSEETLRIQVHSSLFTLSYLDIVVSLHLLAGSAPSLEELSTTLPVLGGVNYAALLQTLFDSSMFTFPYLHRFVFNEMSGTTKLRTFFERHPLLRCIGYSAIEFNTAAAHSLQNEYLLQEMIAYEESTLGISLIVDVMANQLTTLTIHSASWKVLDNSLTHSTLRACHHLRELTLTHWAGFTAQVLMMLGVLVPGIAVLNVAGSYGPQLAVDSHAPPYQFTAHYSCFFAGTTYPSAVGELSLQTHLVS